MSLIIAESPLVVATDFSTTFSLTERENTSSTGFARLGMPFKKGDIPSGYVPKIVGPGSTEVTTIQYDRRVTWDDGSLAFAACAGDFGSFTALQQKDYTISAVAGSFDNTPTFTWSDVLNDIDARIDFTNVRESVTDGSFNDLDTTASSATFRINIAGHSMSVGDKFYCSYGTTGGGLNFGSTVTHPAVRKFTVNNADTDWFEADHATQTASSTLTGDNPGLSVYMFSNGLNDYRALVSEIVNSAVYIETIGSGPAMTEFRAWQYAKDTTTLSLDTQQMIVWYITVWDDGTHSSNGNIEIGAKVVRPVWDVAGKSAWWCDASFKIDSVEQEAHSDVITAAHTGWTTADTDADNDGGRRHWQTAANRPTLLYEPNISYWNTTGKIPPLDEDQYPAAYDKGLYYDAGGYEPNNGGSHKLDLDGVSGYNGRGAICESEANMLIRLGQGVGTATEVAVARIEALVGITCPQNFRTSTNTLIPMILDRPGHTPASTVYNADGLGNTQYAYRSGTSTYQGGYTTPTGGYGTNSRSLCFNWQDTEDHSSNHSAGMYVYEAEPWLYDNVLDICMSYVHRKDGTTESGRSALLYDSDPRGTAYSIPTENYDSVSYNSVANIRKHCFHNVMPAGAWGLRADDDMHANMIDDIRTNHEEWLTDMMSYLPTEMTDLGLIWEKGYQSSTSGEPIYMHALILHGMLRAASITDSATFKAAANILVNFGKFLMNESCYLADTNSIIFKKSATEQAPELGSYGYDTVPAYGMAYGNDASLVGSTGVWTFTPPFDGTWEAGTLIRQDDTNASLVVSELVIGQDYYLVNPVGDTFQISETLGGSALTFASDYSDVNLAIKMTNWDKAIVGADGWANANKTIVGDEYYSIMEAGLRWANFIGCSNADASLIAKMETFHSTYNIDYGPWMLRAA